MNVCTNTDVQKRPAIKVYGILAQKSSRKKERAVIESKPGAEERNRNKSVKKPIQSCLSPQKAPN
jgi:hypothetical protein